MSLGRGDGVEISCQVSVAHGTDGVVASALLTGIRARVLPGDPPSMTAQDLLFLLYAHLQSHDSSLAVMVQDFICPASASQIVTLASARNRHFHGPTVQILGRLPLSAETVASVFAVQDILTDPDYFGTWCNSGKICHFFLRFNIIVDGSVSTTVFDNSTLFYTGVSDAALGTQLRHPAFHLEFEPNASSNTAPVDPIPASFTGVEQFFEAQPVLEAEEILDLSALTSAETSTSDLFGIIVPESPIQRICQNFVPLHGRAAELAQFKPFNNHSPFMKVARAFLAVEHILLALGFHVRALGENRSFRLGGADYLLTAGDILRHFGWNIQTFRNKVNIYSAARKIATLEWRGTADTDDLLYATYSSICSLWGPSGALHSSMFLADERSSSPRGFSEKSIKDHQRRILAKCSV